MPNDSVSNALAVDEHGHLAARVEALDLLARDELAQQGGDTRAELLVLEAELFEHPHHALGAGDGRSVEADHGAVSLRGFKLMLSQRDRALAITRRFRELQIHQNQVEKPSLQ